ncbi:MAG: hypothetical protein Q8904_06100 [Bacteroidota bacterium]|nr:hypothetical protein [Bacteroidota bacterium]
MKKRIVVICIVVLFTSTFHGRAQNLKIANELLTREWTAKWVTHTEGLFSLKTSGLFLFRKNIVLQSVPERFIVHISADNRYKLFINGVYVGTGPVVSDVQHWFFDTYDIASYLKPGENVIAAEVWNWGSLSPWNQISYRTAFIMQGNSMAESVVNTDSSWIVRKSEAIKFFATPREEFNEDIGAGPNENFHASLYPYSWKTQIVFPDMFIPVTCLNQGIPASLKKRTYEWKLVPRSIPFMEEKPQKFSKVLRSSDKSLTGKFIRNETETIPPNTRVKFLIDQSVETCAYPVLKVSKGKDSNIKLVYSESLFDDHGTELKRNTTDGRVLGLYDRFVPSGDENVEFTTLWFRAFRYVELNIETNDEPLIIHSFSSIFNAYPFKLNSSFECNDSLVNKVFTTGWRTGRLCAHENYVDCPYYERLQYFGDFPYSNPITCLLSGDLRLMRNAIDQGDWSRQSDELTFCAYPGNAIGKIIPQFSLAWVDMIYNYLLYSGDKTIVTDHLKGIEEVIGWYTNHLNKQYLLGPMPYWNFVDCNSVWPWSPENASICEPTGSKTGNSALLTLQFAYGLMKAKEIMNLSGNFELRNEYESLLSKINKSVFDLCYDTGRRYISETPEKFIFSQHTNILAACTGCIGGDLAKDVLRRLIRDKSLIQISMQFRAYYHIALVKNNIQQNYVDQLDDWKQLLKDGFTTFPEYPDISSRSDCHAWTAFPAYELLTIVCGFQPINAGMTKYIIEPQLGKLTWVKGSIFNNKGNLTIHVSKTNENRYKGELFIPKGVEAVLKVNGKEVALKSGVNIKF